MGQKVVQGSELVTQELLVTLAVVPVLPPIPDTTGTKNSQKVVPAAAELQDSPPPCPTSTRLAYPIPVTLN